jgi:hypothetical protein
MNIYTIVYRSDNKLTKRIRADKLKTENGFAYFLVDIKNSNKMDCVLIVNMEAILEIEKTMEGEKV